MPGRSGRYDGASIALHWATTVLVLVLIPVGLKLAALPFPSAVYDTVHLWHRSLGEIAFVLALAWVWRRTRRAPIARIDDAPWRRRAAGWIHGLLLALLVLVPSTKLIRGAFGLGWSFFSLHLAAPLGPDPAFSKPLGAAHDYGAFALIGLLGAHILAAIWHALIRRDGAFDRMLPRR